MTQTSIQQRPQSMPTRTPGAQSIEQALEARADLLRKVLPKHLTPERLIKVALLARSRSPQLLQCTTESLVRAVLQCAEMGLEPSGSIGGAHLVPFKNNKTGQWEATCIPDYRGLIDIARRSGQIRSIEAHPIYANEKYRVRFGSEPVLEHEPLLVGPPGDLIAVYAVAKLADGATQVEVMTKDSVDRIRSRSRAGNSGPWVTDYEAMAKKTVLRQLCKYLPRSRELQEALDVDESIEAGQEPIVNLALPADATPPPAPTKSESVKARMRTRARMVDVQPGETEEQAIARTEAQPAQEPALPPEPPAPTDPGPESEDVRMEYEGDAP